MKKIFSILSILIVLFSACGGVKPISNKVVNVSNEEASLLWQQTSAEYSALCHQAFNIAKHRIESMARDERSASNKRPAVVLDLDETVIDNSPYNGYLLLNDKRYDEDSWSEWVSLSSAILVPGAKEFIEYANANGIELLYISNRKEQDLGATLENLSSQNIMIKQDNVYLRTKGTSKEDRRDIAESRYNILLLIGDNLADFDNDFEYPLNITQRKDLVDRNRSQFGVKFIILPNVMYGEWKKALGREDASAVHQKDEVGNRRLIKDF